MKKLLYACLLPALLLCACGKESGNSNEEGGGKGDKPKADLELTMDRTTKVLYYGERTGKPQGVYSYFFGLGDKEFIKDDEGDDAADEGGHIIYFDLYSATPAESFETAVLPDGTYPLSEGYVAGTLNNYYTRMQVWDNGKQKSIDFIDGSLTVSTSDKGKLIEALFTLADQTTVSCSYEGPLVFGDPDAGAGEGETIPDIKEPVDAVFSSAMGVYYGDEYNSGTDNFEVAFATVPFNEEGGLTAAGYGIVLSLYTEPCSSFIAIAPGTYKVEESYKAGTIEAGFGFMGEIFGSICAKVNGEGTTEELSAITGGSVIVSETLTGYKFVFDLTTSEGVSVKGSFEGDIAIEDESPKAEPDTTLTGDYTLNLTAADEVGVAYFGDAFENGNAAWILSIANSKGDAIDITLITPATDSKTEIPLPEKQYNMSVDYGVGFLKGESSDSGQSGTWYYDLSTMDDEGYIYGYAAAIDGWVKLAKNGDNTDVSFSFVDENWNLFSGSWSGKLPAAEDKSSSVASAAKKAKPAVRLHSAKHRVAAKKAQKPQPHKAHLVVKSAK